MENFFDVYIYIYIYIRCESHRIDENCKNDEDAKLLKDSGLESQHGFLFQSLEKNVLYITFNNAFEAEADQGTLSRSKKKRNDKTINTWAVK
jgi:hypothetical protein